jgi:hypothetical protein
MLAETFTPENIMGRRSRLQARLKAAKRAFTTRRVNLDDCVRLIRTNVAPKPGDLVLARVSTVGQHARIENIHGRRGALFVGDEIIVAYGNRYAPDQFEAYVPADMSRCHLVAGGGVAAMMASRHARMKQPTIIEPVGLIADADGRAVNLSSYAIETELTAEKARPYTIAVAGSSMNAGKTTTVASIVRGLTLAGLKVGTAKITGTGSGGDLWSMIDSGAVTAIDFTDAGHASTFGLDADALASTAERLLDALAHEGVDVAVVEIADGLLQHETAAMLGLGRNNRWFDNIVFAAADAMGAAFGVNWLNERGHHIAAVSGLVSASPLASREAAKATGLHVATIAELTDAVQVTKLLFPEMEPERKVA